MYKGDYANAKIALKNVITSGKYDLVPGENGQIFSILAVTAQKRRYSSRISLLTRLSVTGVEKSSAHLDGNEYLGMEDFPHGRSA
jgi:hypothetical protein